MSYVELIGQARQLLKDIVAKYPIMSSFYGPAGYDWSGTREENPAGIGSFVFLDETLVNLHKRLVYNLQFIFDNLEEDRKPVWNGTRYDSLGETENFYNLNGYANSALSIEEWDGKDGWIPHYDLYYVRSNMYDLLPGANSGKTYLEPIITKLNINLEKVCKKYWDQYVDWVRTASETFTWSITTGEPPTTTSGSYTVTWWNGGNYPRSIDNFCQAKWVEIMETTIGPGGVETSHGTGRFHWGAGSAKNSGAVVSGSTGGSSGSHPADKYFWTEARQAQAHSDIVSNVASLIEEVTRDFNIMSQTVLDISSLFESYSTKFAVVNQFIMEEDKKMMEDGTKASSVYKDIDYGGFNIYNTQVSEAYNTYTWASKMYGQYFPGKVQERQLIMSKLAQHKILSGLDYWNRAWGWYQGIMGLRKRRNI